MNRQNRRTAARWGIRVVTVAAGGWFLYSFFKAEAAIQSGILALIGVAASAIMAHWSAKKREIEARHFAEKREGYNSFIDIMFDVVDGDKTRQETTIGKATGDKNSGVQKDAPDLGRRARNQDVERGRNLVWRIPIEIRQKVLLMWDSLLREMRKDLGKDDSELDDGDLVSLILLAEEKHKVKD